ncbi:PDZ domain-containing protein [Candidatus Parcubacteria bacterium]|nr:MAG: PDZ domain-containing protein [Candidatus Parcubacteria bacterium]
MSQRKKFFIIFFLGVTLGGFLASFSAPPRAQADFLTDLWNNFLAPFKGKSPDISAPPSAPGAPQKPEAVRPEPSVPLYQPVIDYEKAVVQAVKKASPAVVAITVSKNVPILENCPFNPFADLPEEFRQFFGDFPQFSQPCEKGSRLEQVGGGSGFTISSDGLVITNKHVISDPKASYTVFTNEGKKYDARVLARDPLQDLAVVKIDATGLPTVELGDSDALELGQTAIAIGNALAEFRNTVSVGVISGLARNITAAGGGGVETIHGVIQTDAAINPGNSGGPLLNLRGQVVGINTAVVSGAQNIGFAIPINKAKRAIQSVKTSGEIQIPFIGVRYIVITPEIAEEQKLPVTRGALLRGMEDGPAVMADSPAEKAGLRAEDIIVELNGQKVDNDNPLGALIVQKSVGETVTLKVLREGKEVMFRVTLAKRSE